MRMNFLKYATGIQHGFRSLTSDIEGHGVSGWNSRLIYADVTGFGEQGPDANDVGHVPVA